MREIMLSGGRVRLLWDAARGGAPSVTAAAQPVVLSNLDNIISRLSWCGRSTYSSHSHAQTHATTVLCVRKDGQVIGTT